MNKAKNLAIIQARMGSSRLPGKALLPINNIPIIEWILIRVSMSAKLDDFVFAIPDTSIDQPLYDFLTSKNVNVYRGNEDDVLTRFYETAKKFNGGNIIRICGDNPFIDPVSIDKLIQFFEEKDCSYGYNHIPRENRYPDGAGAEIVDLKTLEKVNNGAKTEEQREHIFNYIWDNPQLFDIQTFDPNEEWLMRPDLRLDIDTREDYDNYNDLKLTPNADIRDIIEYKDKN